MKKLYHLLFFLLLLSSTVAAAQSRPVSTTSTRSSGSAELITQINTHALHLTAFLTEALFLTQNQVAAVRQATLLQLIQQGKAEGASAEILSQRYEASMLQLLTPGQYAAFCWLQNQPSATNALLQTASARVVQQ